MSDNALVPQDGDAAAPAVVTQSSRITRHLALAVQLEESGTHPLINFTIFLVCAACLSFLLWASITRIDEIAVTEGQIVPTGLIQTVQHLEGGIVEDLMVKEGELVDAGQPLLRLSPAAANADLDQTRAREVGLRLKAERLRAFAEERQPDFSFAGPGFDQLVADNQAIFNTQSQARDTTRAVILSQIDQRTSDIHMLERQLQTGRKQVAAIGEEAGIREELLAKGLASKVTALENRRELARVEGELARTTDQITTAREALGEAERKLIDQKTGVYRQTMDDLGATVSELAQVEESLGRLEDRVKRLVVTAPVRGYVKGLKVNNPGAVIAPGGTVADIVPSDGPMKVESRVQPRDVGYLKAGQPVKVKVSTYDFARFGAITGHISTISAASFLTEKGEAYFLAQIALDADYVGNDPAQHKISPGMTVEADVVTGDKTLLQYLLKPIFTQTQGAFHER